MVLSMDEKELISDLKEIPDEKEEKEEELANPKIIESTMKYFFYDLKTRSQTQHRDLISDFKAFVKCFPEYADKYNLMTEKMLTQPVDYFIKNNKKYLHRDRLNKIDVEYTLASLDFVYFRDTSYANQLKTSYEVTYKRITRDRKNLLFNELLDVMGYIRETLYNEMIDIARKMNLDVPLILPAVEKQDQGAVGLATKGNLN